MATLHEIADRTFAWRPVKDMRRTIEVCAGHDVFGTLRLERGGPAVAEVDGEHWVFEVGKGNVTARDENGSTLATFVAGKDSEGTLTLAGGQTLRWARTHPGQAERAFYDEHGTRVVRFWKDNKMLTVEDRGAADPGMAARREFPLLVVLGRVIGIGQDDYVDEAMAAMLGAFA